MVEGSVAIDGRQLRGADVYAVAHSRARVTVTPAGLATAASAHRVATEVMAREPVYGRTTGVGANRLISLSGSEIQGHGLRMLRSHAGGAGNPISAPDARAGLVVRLNQLVTGGAGVQPQLITALADAINAGLYPPVRTYGAIGTGDLTALATTALCLLGESEWVGGSRPPVTVDDADALAFISSNAFTVGSAALAAHELAQALDAGLIVAALSLLAVDGSAEPFAAAVQAARPHPGQLRAAAHLRRLLGTRPEPKRRVQDPYGYRALPQVHGAALDALTALDRVLGVELNAAAENPLIDITGHRVLHNGNFHAGYLALALDGASAALVPAAALSVSRLSTLLDPALTGLRGFLAGGPPGSSGAMILEYVAHSALADMRQQATPSVLGSAVLSLGSEDHASFAAQSVAGTNRLARAYPTVLACELVAAVRAARLRGLAPEGPLAEPYLLASRALPDDITDRPLEADLASASALLAELAHWATDGRDQPDQPR
jgi:histidine ammonia-lyase